MNKNQCPQIKFDIALGDILKAITNFIIHQKLFKYWFTLLHFAMDDPAHTLRASFLKRKCNLKRVDTLPCHSSLIEWLQSQCFIQWVYKAPLYITLRIKTWVVAYFDPPPPIKTKTKNFFIKPFLCNFLVRTLQGV